MIRIGVVRGGASPKYYNDSLTIGSGILSHLKSELMSDKYWPVDIFVDKDGVWHMNGIPTTLDILRDKVDVLWNALQGDYGKNGQVQKLLEKYRIPFTGTNSDSSIISYNKALTKERFAELGINTPKHILFSAYFEDMDGPRREYIENKSREVLNLLPPPWIVKPLTNGSSMGIHVCKTFQELVRAFTIGTKEKVSILVEEMIEGKEVVISVANNFRNQSVYPFLQNENLSKEEKREVESLATLIHDKLNLNHYSQIHFIISPKKGVYAIEVNTLPDLTESSHLNKHLELVGSSMPEFIDHIINLAVNKNK